MPFDDVAHRGVEAAGGVHLQDDEVGAVTLGPVDAAGPIGPVTGITLTTGLPLQTTATPAGAAQSDEAAGRASCVCLWRPL